MWKRPQRIRTELLCPSFNSENLFDYNNSVLWDVVCSLWCRFFLLNMQLAREETKWWGKKKKTQEEAEENVCFKRGRQYFLRLEMFLYPTCSEPTLQMDGGVAVVVVRVVVAKCIHVILMVESLLCFSVSTNWHPFFLFLLSFLFSFFPQHGMLYGFKFWLHFFHSLFFVL